MSIPILILGQSSSGKSTSIGAIPEIGHVGLNPKETLIIQVKAKPLPFKSSDYKKFEEGKVTFKDGANIIVLQNWDKIIDLLKTVSDKIPHFKNIVIDDFQYIMSSEFMDLARETGFQKFTNMADHVYRIIDSALNLRSDLLIFFLSHSDLDEKSGTYKFKTIGKLLDEKITLEGLYTIVLYAINTIKGVGSKQEVEYKFATNMTAENGIIIPAKSPRGMFDKILIQNDLGYVRKQVEQYYS